MKRSFIIIWEKLKHQGIMLYLKYLSPIKVAPSFLFSLQVAHILKFFLFLRVHVVFLPKMVLISSVVAIHNEKSHKFLMAKRAVWSLSSLSAFIVGIKLVMKVKIRVMQTDTVFGLLSQVAHYMMFNIQMPVDKNSIQCPFLPLAFLVP